MSMIAMTATTARGFVSSRVVKPVSVLGRHSTVTVMGNDHTPTRPFHSTTARPFFQNILDSLKPGKSAQHIGFSEMKDLLSKLDKQGRKKMSTVVVDVRSVPEVSQTGPLSPSVITLPLDLIQNGALELSAQDFEQKFKFAKPDMTDETLVFTCKSGMRAGMAADVAAAAGYKNVVVYSGSANEWFSRK
uniref:Rhodanese domain-containing protein n=1 Tax=Amphora coffeiformis TaxID=265554 RepID=A0A7S3LB93_9STRA